MMKKQFLRLTVLAFAALAPLAVLAQAWPAKQPIKLVVVFPAGGSVDQVARILQVPLQQELGQTVVVDNKGGASGAIGTAFVAQAPADGYTLGVVFDTHAVNPSLNPSMAFDTRKNLVNISVIGKSGMVLATNVGSEYKTFADVVAAAKAKKSVSYGSIGSGSLGHLAMTLLGKSSGFEWQHIPYKGGGPLMNDAIAGHVPLSIGTVFLTKPHIDNKRMRPLAVTSSKRSPDLPDVPTFVELGYAGFEAQAWWGVVAPVKTPADIVKRVNEAINKILKNPDIAKKLDAQGIDVMGGTPAEANAFILRQMTIWDKVVKDNSIKAD
jgi:tripartite-type tricarboxylate transporter receptor subunit TctC